MLDHLNNTRIKKTLIVSGYRIANTDRVAFTIGYSEITFRRAVTAWPFNYNSYNTDTNAHVHPTTFPLNARSEKICVNYRHNVRLYSDRRFLIFTIIASNRPPRKSLSLVVKTNSFPSTGSVTTWRCPSQSWIMSVIRVLRRSAYARNFILTEAMRSVNVIIRSTLQSRR